LLKCKEKIPQKEDNVYKMCKYSHINGTKIEEVYVLHVVLEWVVLEPLLPWIFVWSKWRWNTWWAFQISSTRSGTRE